MGSEGTDTNSTGTWSERSDGSRGADQEGNTSIKLEETGKDFSNKLTVRFLF